MVFLLALPWASIRFTLEPFLLLLLLILLNISLVCWKTAATAANRYRFHRTHINRGHSSALSHLISSSSVYLSASSIREQKDSIHLGSPPHSFYGNVSSVGTEQTDSDQVSKSNRKTRLSLIRSLSPKLTSAGKCVFVCTVAAAAAATRVSLFLSPVAILSVRIAL